MEQRNYGKRKSRIPAFVRGRYTRHLTQETSDRLRSLHDQDTKDFNRESGASKKTVTMAPTSRYMAGRSLYTARKPLISTEHHVSILKNPLTHTSEGVRMNNVLNYQTQDELVDSNMSDRTSDAQFTAFTLSATREDLYAPLNLSELKKCSSYEEPNFSPLPSANKFECGIISSSSIDDLSLTVPSTPKWPSTQQNVPHSSTCQTCTYRRANTSAFKQERRSHLTSSFSLSNNKRFSSEPKQKSHYQTTYWACAIPSTLPPSPDHKSPSWDPDKEYQSLLDYTYPLRPNMSKICSSNEHRLRTDQQFLDSGIEVDSFLSSSSLSFLNQNVSGMKQGGSGPFGFPNQNMRKLAHFKSSDIRGSRSLSSSLEQLGLSSESLDCERKGIFHCKKLGIFPTSRFPPTFIRSTSILSHPGSLSEWDEEFLQLPKQLQEIQDLSQKLKDITAQISQPVTTNWECLQRTSGSVKSSTIEVEKQVAEVCVQGSSKNVPLNEQKGVDTVQIISHRVTRDNLRNVGSIVDQLGGMSLYEFNRNTNTDKGVESQTSLLQHLQTFCSNLEKLIQWLHKVVKRMDILSPPSVDIESVKASLADYKRFQEEVQSHRSLTASVLQTGEMLLCCMNSASPFLKDTLTLIERQTHALETHSEYLFSSILSTMDCLTEPSSQDDTEDTSFSNQEQ